MFKLLIFLILILFYPIVSFADLNKNPQSLVVRDLSTFTTNDGYNKTGMVIGFKGDNETFIMSCVNSGSASQYITKNWNKLHNVQFLSILHLEDNDFLIIINNIIRDEAIEFFCKKIKE